MTLENSLQFIALVVVAVSFIIVVKDFFSKTTWLVSSNGSYLIHEGGELILKNLKTI